MVQLLGRPLCRILRLHDRPQMRIHRRLGKTIKQIHRSNKPHRLCQLSTPPSTMSYVAQIANISPTLIKAEKWALQRITHVPHDAFPNDTFLYQQEIGMRIINPLQIISEMAMIRTAKITCSWKAECIRLRKATNGKGPCQTSPSQKTNQTRTTHGGTTQRSLTIYLKPTKQSQLAHGAPSSNAPTERKDPLKLGLLNGSKTPWRMKRWW